MREPAVPAVASTGLVGLLTGPVVRGHVLGSLPAAAYLSFPPASVVALEAPGAVGLPCGLTLAGGPPPARPGTSASIGRGRLLVGDRAVRVARWHDPRPRLAATTAHALAARAARARRLLPPVVDAVDRRVADGLGVLADAVARGDLDAAVGTVDGLVGLGSGSTPSGDDVLAGLVAAGQLLPAATDGPGGPGRAWFARLGAAVAARAVDRTPALSATLLRHAAHAEVAEPAATLLHALVGTRDLAPALTALRAVGHSSGTDLARGILVAAEVVAGPTTAARAREAAHA